MSSKLYIFTKKIMHNEKQISMRTCRARMGAASQGAFAVTQEIPHSDISGIIKKSAGDFLLVCRFSFYMLTPRFSRCLRSLHAARNKRSVIYLCALRRRRGLRHRRRVRCRRVCLPVCCLMTVCLPDGCLSKTC